MAILTVEQARLAHGNKLAREVVAGATVWHGGFHVSRAYSVRQFARGFDTFPTNAGDRLLAQEEPRAQVIARFNRDGTPLISGVALGGLADFQRIRAFSVRGQRYLLVTDRAPEFTYTPPNGSGCEPKIGVAEEVYTADVLATARIYTVDPTKLDRTNLVTGQALVEADERVRLISRLLAVQEQEIDLCHVLRVQRAFPVERPKPAKPPKQSVLAHIGGWMRALGDLAFPKPPSSDSKADGALADLRKSLPPQLSQEEQEIEDVMHPRWDGVHDIHALGRLEFDGFSFEHEYRLGSDPQLNEHSGALTFAALEP